MDGLKTRILIVDDHPAVREALAMRIARQPDLAVVGEADDIATALEAAEATHPQVAIVDISLKTGNGLDLIRRIREKWPAMRILVWSMFADSLYAERSLRAGAHGYLNKQRATEEIINAIRAVCSGQMYFSSDISQRLMVRAAGGQEPGESTPANVLSDRELQVFQLIGQGLKTGEIAKRLHLSVHTIETHRQRIKEKLQLEGSTVLTREAVQWVLENG